jgi:hypothetical protein
MVIVSMLTNTMPLYDFLIIGIAWTIGCLIPCVDTPFYLNAKHKARQIKRELRKRKLHPEAAYAAIRKSGKNPNATKNNVATQTNKELTDRLKQINVNRNRHFHTVTMMLICSAIVFYLMTEKATWVESTFHFSVHYFYWGICFAFATGYALHLVLDCFGYAPMPLFLFFVDDPYNIPIRIRRGSTAMKVVTAGLTIIFIIYAIKINKILIR